jgi:four helix bundle protein
VLLINRATREFPKEEMYGLTSPMRRAAVSVPSSIVEGCARESQVEDAFGSLRELHSQLGLSKRLGYSDEHEISTCESKTVEAEKVLGALLRSMRG